MGKGQLRRKENTSPAKGIKSNLKADCGMVTTKEEARKGEVKPGRDRQTYKKRFEALPMLYPASEGRGGVGNRT